MLLKKIIKPVVDVTVARYSACVVIFLMEKHILFHIFHFLLALGARVVFLSSH